jgi:hypothetical protein
MECERVVRSETYKIKCQIRSSLQLECCHQRYATQLGEEVALGVGV